MMVKPCASGGDLAEDVTLLQEAVSVVEHSIITLSPTER